MYTELLSKWRAKEAEEAFLAPAGNVCKSRDEACSHSKDWRVFQRKHMELCTGQAATASVSHWPVQARPFVSHPAYVVRRARRASLPRKAKAGWCLPSGHGLDPKHDTLLRVRPVMLLCVQADVSRM